MARRSSQLVDWAVLFGEWRGSGLTQPEFCRRRGIPLHTFRRRLYQPNSGEGEMAGDSARPTSEPRLNACSPARTPANRFIPVRVVDDDRAASGPSASSNQGRPVEVVLVCGRRITVPPGFDAETLLRVMTLLEPRGC